MTAQTANCYLVLVQTSKTFMMIKNDRIVMLPSKFFVTDGLED